VNRQENSYREVLGSDVPGEGMYVELYDPSDKVVALVFKPDCSDDFEVHLGPFPAPREIVEAFVERAKKRLAERPAV